VKFGLSGKKEVDEKKQTSQENLFQISRKKVLFCFDQKKKISVIFVPSHLQSQVVKVNKM
jgi:hypothetical protein